MLLATSTIKAALDDGAIICVPPPPRIEGAHIDITLGNHAWLFDPAREEEGEVLSELDISTADPADWFESWDAIDGYIWLPAQSTILAHTREYIGTAPGSGLVPMLHTRSTLARWGLSVCTANAGQGDEGYCTRWTLEIVNPHQRTILIPVGSRVGSISFHRAEGTAQRYQIGTRYNATIAQWQPSHMLPRRGNLL
jgi:deoxycytidine triphosphate deaminase